LRSLRTNLLVVSASVLALFTILEIALRIAGQPIGARTDPISPFGPRYLPRSPFVNAEENTVRGRMNDLGFHDRLPAFDADPRRRRIAFFGDSFVEALQVEADSTFASRLEDLANASGLPLEAAAFGISGSGADQSLFRCRHALLQSRLDDVVYVFFVNDFFDGFLVDQKPPSWPFLERAESGAVFFSGAHQPDRGARSVRSILKPLLKEMYLPSFVSYRLHIARTRGEAERGRFRDATGDSILGLFYLGDAVPARHLAATAHWEEVVRYWRRLCAASGVVFRVLYIPPVWEADDSTFAAVFGGRIPRHGISERMATFCAEEGIPFLDPTAALAASAGGRARDLYWSHLNDGGHRALAAFLLERLREEWGAGRPRPG